MSWICKWFGHNKTPIKDNGCINVGYCKRCLVLVKIDNELPYIYKTKWFNIHNNKFYL